MMLREYVDLRSWKIFQSRFWKSIKSKMMDVLSLATRKNIEKPRRNSLGRWRPEIVKFVMPSLTMKTLTWRLHNIKMLWIKNALIFKRIVLYFASAPRATTPSTDLQTVHAPPDRQWITRLSTYRQFGKWVLALISISSSKKFPKLLKSWWKHVNKCFQMGLMDFWIV